jgi:mono/diheme cytochrome c family protein
MPPYAGTLSDQAIWKIVTYLRAQPVPRDVPTEAWVRTAP